MKLTQEQKSEVDQFQISLSHHDAWVFFHFAWVRGDTYKITYEDKYKVMQDWKSKHKPETIPDSGGTPKFGSTVDGRQIMETIEIDLPLHCMFRGVHEAGGKFSSWCKAGLVKKGNKVCPKHAQFPEDCPLKQGVTVKQKSVVELLEQND